MFVVVENVFLFCLWYHPTAHLRQSELNWFRNSNSAGLGVCINLTTHLLLVLGGKVIGNAAKGVAAVSVKGGTGVTAAIRGRICRQECESVKAERGVRTSWAGIGGAG